MGKFSKILAVIGCFAFFGSGVAGAKPRLPNGPKSGIMQSAGGFSLLEPSVVPSSGVLHRKKDGVFFDGTFRALESDSAYSIWWIIFNDPSACAQTPCGEPDIIAGAGQVFYAGGFTTDGAGVGNVSARLPRGPVPQGADRFSEFVSIIDPASETGLRNTKGAQIGVVARYHGDIDPLILGSQIGTYLGGCDVPGVNCADVQIVIFAPPAP